MAATLKASRTKLKNKLVEDFIPQIRIREESARGYRQMDREHLEEESRALALRIDGLQKKYDAINALDQRIVAAYEGPNEHNNLIQFQALLEADDHLMEQTEAGILSLKDFQRRVDGRIQHLDTLEEQRENPQQVVAGFPDAAQLAAMMQQAVAAAVPDPAQQAELMGQAVANALAQQNPAHNVQADDEDAAPHIPVVVPAVIPAAGGPNANVRAPINVKLPKFEMPKFSGDIMQWNGFWEQFAAAVHDTGLPVIQKFTYLRAQLQGEAYDSISGYRLRADNYQVCVDKLHERFGRNDMVIKAHYCALQNLPKTSGQTSKLRSFYTTLERHILSLEALGENVNNLGTVNLITTKLPNEVLTRLELKKANDDADWTVQTLRDALKKDIQFRESLNQSEKIMGGLFADQDLSNTGTVGTKPKHNSVDRSGTPRPHTSAEALVAADSRNTPRRPCIFCKKSHYNDDCTQFATLSSRKKQLGDRCFRCFRTGHAIGDCQIIKTCFHCKEKGKHNRSLCPTKFGQRDTKHRGKHVEPAAIVVAKKGDESDSSEEHLLACGDSVIMQTALVKLPKSHQSTSCSVRIFFDCGATRSHITMKLAKNLGLKMGAEEEDSVVTFGSNKVQTIKGRTVLVPIPLNDGTVMEITAKAMPHITGKINRTAYDKKLCSYLGKKNLVMADSVPVQNETATLELLIGQDYYLDFILPEKEEVRPGLYLLNTVLGWILSGRLEENGSRPNDVNLLVLTYASHLQPECAVFAHPDSSIQTEPDMADFWKLDTIGVETPTEKSDEQFAVEQFEKSVKIVNNRIQVRWPWREDNPDLPTNYALSFHRFRAVAKRLEADPELQLKYGAIINEQVKLGIIEAVTPETLEGPLKHYVPHHPVQTPTKTTTKVRVVYDASAKSKKGNKSLNDCLYPGPVLIHDLCGMLLRFRLLPVAIVADIEKAFLNIDLQMDDRDVTRFFWFKDATIPKVDNNLQIYRFCRVPFGVTSSPFLLASAVNHLLDSYGSAVALQIKKDIYVDNVITGAQDVPSAVKLYEESQVMFRSVSFNLREWSSNSVEFLDQIPQEHRAEGSIFKVLGITWNTTSDCLTITGFDKEKFEHVTTKREALQALASVYDPLGYFTPVILMAKLFLRSLWMDKMDWDEKLSVEKLLQWNDVFLLLQAISSHPIPRFIGHLSTSSAIYQLHCFCDVSAECYATTVYLRSMLDGDCHINLIFSKIRLSPSTTLTIPRLELMAALIGKRSLDFVEKQLCLPLDAKILWSDSQCVLHWIRDVNDRSKSLSVFIGNRVAEIKQNTDITYRYVNTVDNPADMASHGCC